MTACFVHHKACFFSLLLQPAIKTLAAEAFFKQNQFTNS